MTSNIDASLEETLSYIAGQLEDADFYCFAYRLYPCGD